jgi:GDP-L-fucose synthase
MAVAKLPIDAKIYVTGHQGLVGYAITRQLRSSGFDHLIFRSREGLDLTARLAVRRFFTTERPQYVFLAAAKVGGMQANDQYPADFIRDNLLIHINVIDAAYREGVAKLLCLGSSFICPKHAPQPMKAEYLLTGPLEPTTSGMPSPRFPALGNARRIGSNLGSTRSA